MYPNQGYQGVSKNYARNMQMLNEIKNKLPIHQAATTPASCVDDRSIASGGSPGLQLQLKTTNDQFQRWNMQKMP